jgi:aminodeoxyfutalosine deaminase
MPCPMHAGETVGPDQVWSAIDLLGAERIGHGIAAAQDPALMAELVSRGIALEVCPTSNVCTGAVPSLAEHPFPTLRDAGVRLTLNTDDPGMFGTDLDREYVLAHEMFGLTAHDLAEMARESIRSSFAPEPTRARVRSEIDAYEAAALA